MSFGRLLACNEFVLSPGAGFGTHQHAGVDIVTVVLSGSLTHVTALGTEQRGPGVYVLPTGSGVEHDERNDGAGEARFVQAFLVPGTGDPAVQVQVLALSAGERVDLAGPAFVLVTSGSVGVGADVLSAGDSLRAETALVSLVAQDEASLVAVFP